MSLEVLDEKLDALRERTDTADRMTQMKLDAICDEMKQINGYVRQNDRRITRTEERQKLITGLQSGLTLITSSLAAWLGIRN